MQRCNCGGAACKSAKVSEGLEAGVVTTFRSRVSGDGSQVRVQVQDLNFTRHLHLYLNTRARDLRAETCDLRTCDARCRYVVTRSRPYPRQTGQEGRDVVSPLPCGHHAAPEDDRGGHPYQRDEVARGHVGTVTRGHGEECHSKGTGDRRVGWG